MVLPNYLFIDSVKVHAYSDICIKVFYQPTSQNLNAILSLQLIILLYFKVLIYKIFEFIFLICFRSLTIETVEFSNIKLWVCHEVPAPAREKKSQNVWCKQRETSAFQHDFKAQVAVWSERHPVVLTFEITDHSWPKFGQSTNLR